MNNIKFISPFKRLCVTVGSLPSSYVESMSYYECLTYFMNFLEKEVIPAINNNAEVVKELQDFVANYFDNLDVQEEINNKLDDMAESGVLAEIINEEIFNTLNSQVETNTEDISDIKDDLSLKNNKKYLLIGDSYSTGYQGAGISDIEGFFEKVVDQLSLNATILDGNGYGFIGMTNTLTWKNLVTNAGLSDKDSYTDIIICGGMNDRGTDIEFENAMIDTFDYLKTNFQNATIHVGCIGRYAAASAANLTAMQRVSKLYKTISISNGCKYIDGSELLLHNLSWFIADGIHPNTLGQNQLAFGIEQYIENGNIDSYYNVNDLSPQNADTITAADANTNLSSLTLYSYMSKEVVNFYIEGAISFSNSIEVDNLTSIKIGRLTSSYVCASKNYQGLDEYITGYVYNDTEINGSHYVKVSFRLYNDYNNDLWLRAFTVMDNGSVLNDLSISEITFPYGVIKCSANSYYC